MRELQFRATVHRGQRGVRVKRVQEWLTLNDIAVAPDGAFGPATERAVREFQQRKRLSVDGAVGAKTFARLVQPMSYAVSEIRPRRSLGDTVVAYAKRHLRQHPREIGGQNRGPWVRLYMNGHEGDEWPWCAGFVCFVLRQACAAHDLSPPFKSTFSCDVLAYEARRSGLFVAGKEVDWETLGAGSIFLNRRTGNDWTHTGFVMEAFHDAITTVEGNTNDEGSREGYEVCRRTRGYGDKDFVVLQAP